jgi:predicted nucleotidyltransferase
MAELVKSRRVGRSRLVSGGVSPLQHHLAQLLMMSFGPRQVIAKEFGSLPGVEKLFIFGSWAARFEGDRGFPPSDIDVLIIGNPDLGQVAEVSQKSSKMLSIDVNPTIESHTWWANKSGTGFRKQIASRPLVELEVRGVSNVETEGTRSHKRRSS